MLKRCAGCGLSSSRLLCMTSAGLSTVTKIITAAACAFPIFCLLLFELTLMAVALPGAGVL
jgi:hypothetical protein